MAWTFEFVLHVVRCDMVTVSPNQIIIITKSGELYNSNFLLLNSSKIHMHSAG